MKRFLTIITLAILTATQCSHPYEEGMLGAFPYIEIMSETSANFEAGGSANQKGSIQFCTNMSITAQIEYSSGNTGWISNVSTSQGDGNVTTLSYTVSANTKRSARKAVIKILADNMHTNFSVTVNQAAYQMTGEAVVHDGDLILSSQEEVNDCIYTSITGNLIISGNKIADLSALEHIKTVSGNLTIENCSQLTDLGPLSDLNIYKLHLKGTVVTSILENYTGSFESLEIENSIEQSFDFSVITSFTDLESLKITNSRFKNLVDITEMINLKQVTLLSCSISQSEINFLKHLMPDTTFNIDSNPDIFQISVNQTSEYSAEFNVSLQFDSEPALTEFGYILTTDNLFDFSKRTEVNGWWFGTFIINMNNLDSGQAYNIWIYGISDDNRYFLSEVETFTTLEVNYHTYTVTPEYPLWKGLSDVPKYDYFEAFMFTDIENNIFKTLSFNNSTDGCLSATVPEGYIPIYMIAHNGGRGSGNTVSMSADIIQLQIDESDGIYDDIVFAATHNTFDSDKTESPAFIRPLALIDVNVDFSESVGNLSDIISVDVSFDNLYKNWMLVSDGSQTYSTGMTYKFSKSTDGQSDFVNIASRRYVMPHVTNAERNAVVTITFNSGETISSSTILSEVIEANNIYDITLNVKLNRLNGTFEVDQVEVVDGGIIEF